MIAVRCSACRSAAGDPASRPAPGSPALAVGAALVAALALGCSSGSKAAGDSAGDAAARDLDASTDASLEAALGDASAASACTTLVWMFGGCSTAVLAECEREYALFPVPMQAGVDAYAQCLRSHVPALSGPSSWPPDADASCSPSGDPITEWYAHGACEGYAGQISSDLTAFDPCTGTATPCGALGHDDCQRQIECNWLGSACMGPALPPCSQFPGECPTVLGCTGLGLPECGGVGQPACFFSAVLTGGAPAADL